MAKLKIKARFRDILNKTTFYEVGQEVEFADEARVKDIVSRGLAEVIGKPKIVDPVVFGAIDLSKAVKVVTEAIASETEVESLNKALEAENKQDKPRKAVVDAITARLAELAKAEETIELIDGKVICIVKNTDGTLTAFGEDGGEKMPLEVGEYQSATHVYTVGDAGEVSVAEKSE